MERRPVSFSGSVVALVRQYSPRTSFSRAPPGNWDKELLDPRALIWLRLWLFVEPYRLGPPVARWLCSCTMAPTLKPANTTARVAATIASVDNFIRRTPRSRVLERGLQKKFPPSAAEIERSHAVYQERIVVAAGRPNKRAPSVAQLLKWFDATCFHVRSNT